MSRPPLILTSTMNAAKGAEFSDVPPACPIGTPARSPRPEAHQRSCPILRIKTIQSMVERCDGVMLTGGDDLHPDLMTHSCQRK